MRKTLAVLLALLPSLAAAQTLPPNTVLGRLGVSPGPAQAIPFSSLLAGMAFTPTVTTSGNIAVWGNGTGSSLTDAGGGIPSHPMTHPSSGNIIGAGCTTTHEAWWVDQNLCSNANVVILKSSDPSAGFVLTLTGTVTTGDKVTLHFTFGSGTCVAGASPACDASYTAVGGDTLQHVANGLVCAIANNTNLFTLNGATCSAGVVTPVTGQSFGGYASNSIIGFTVAIPNGLAFDFNSTIALKVTSAVTGAATEVVTIANTNCGTRCSYPLDNNPAIQLIRQSGGAPQPGSTIGAIYAIGATSACPTSYCVNYGNITHWVGNSTAASLSSAWLLQAIATNGSLSGGWWFGHGIYSNVGCSSPFGTTPTGCVVDKGDGSINVPAIESGGAGAGYWVDGVNQIRRNRTGGQFIIEATGTDTVVFSSSAGVGINVAPTGTTFTSALGLFVSGPQLSSTNANGVSLTGGATPSLTARNPGTLATLPMTYLASLHSFVGPVAIDTKIRAAGGAPALTSCGTSPAISGSDLAGEVTMGTGSPTGCIITFNVLYAAVPYCIVSWPAQALASQSYVVAADKITLTQTATTGNKVYYHCFARSAG